jgi:hypothetical protein
VVEVDRVPGLTLKGFANPVMAVNAIRVKAG